MVLIPPLLVRAPHPLHAHTPRSVLRPSSENEAHHTEASGWCLVSLCEVFWLLSHPCQALLSILGA